MITQQLLDTIASLLAGLWSIVPPMPAGVETAWNNAMVALAGLSHSIQNFGIILPFDTWSALLVTWLALLGFWAAVSIVKIGINLVSHIG